MMTVKELKELLDKYDDSLVVYRDYEGRYRGIYKEDIEETPKGLLLSVDW